MTKTAGAAQFLLAILRPPKTGASTPDRTNAITASGTMNDTERLSQVSPTTAITTTAVNPNARAPA